MCTSLQSCLFENLPRFASLGEGILKTGGGAVLGSM